MIDTHVHLDFPELLSDIEAVLGRARDKGVSGFVVPGVTQDNWQRVLDLCGAGKGLYPALGLHPCFKHRDTDRAMQRLESELGSRPDLIAVGEIGLDLFIPGADLEQQLALLRPQLKLAKQFNKPVLLHVRKAHDQILKELRQLKLERAGIVHAFSGSEQQAKEYLKLGFKLGVGGTVTYERATKLRRIVAQLPLQSFVLETDAPDMPLLGYQGQVNYPERVAKVAQVVAGLKGVSLEQVAESTSATCIKLLSI